MTIALCIPYYGAFPNYFQLYLDSLAVNKGVLTVILITDIDLSPYKLPSNLRVIPMALPELRLKIQAFLQESFGKAPPIESIVPTPYKLVDFKIMYPALFEADIASAGDDSYDFVGWGDIDVIYGRLDQFVTAGRYDIIGGWHGHFTAITPAFKNLFKSVPNIYELCTDTSKTHITDEIAFRQPLVDFIQANNKRMCYLNASFCDIVPPCYFWQFRPDHAQFAKNFFNVMKPRKNISHLVRNSDGSLQTIYDDGEVQETSYAHLQKRAMLVPSSLPDKYYITDSAFVTESDYLNPPVIPNNLFMTWKTKDFPPKMKETVYRIIDMNPDFNVQIYDDDDIHEFLAKFFPKEVSDAYHILTPGAFKADLWRLCVLYVYGGIYMDIKLRPVDGFHLRQLLTREYLVSDGDYVDADGTQTKLTSIYNGLMCCKANNPALLRGVVTILFNVSRRFYGTTPYDVTGPRMLARIYRDMTQKEPLYLTHYGPTTNNEYIQLHNKTILENYKEYRDEVPRGASYYANSWATRSIYTDATLDLTQVQRSWPPAFVAVLSEFQSSKKIRLHIPAIPYTITRDEFSHDAFTGKVKRFAPMMRSLVDVATKESVFEVFHYGVETSDSGADRDIQLLTMAEWDTLRVESLCFLDKTLTQEGARKRLDDPTTVVGTLANWSTPLFKEFNRRFHMSLKENYRSQSTDIVCIPLGHSYDDALAGLSLAVVEMGIGYSGSCKDFRVFESHSWLSKTLGEEKRDPHNYWFVIPHAFDVSAFAFTLGIQPKKRIGFLGRIVRDKGCHIIAEVAKRFPTVEFVLCGQGDPAPFLTSPNIVYKAPIHGSERSDYLGSCVATMCPTTYLEPFGCSSVESQLCGTPVISADSGGYVETVEQFRTGLRCHTLADYCKGVQMALDGAFDRAYVRERAMRLYDMFAMAPQYEYVFRSVLDIHTPSKNGWYSPICHLPSAPLSNSSGHAPTGGSAHPRGSNPLTRPPESDGQDSGHSATHMG